MVLEQHLAQPATASDPRGALKGVPAVSTIFRATAGLLWTVRQDLRRPHSFAPERVGFITVKAAQARDHLVLLAHGYHSVADDDYVDDPRVGAMMGQEAIRKGLDLALLEKVGIFHVHEHGHKGRPRFSRVDLTEQANFVPDFFKVRPEMPHGAIVLSHDRATGRVWLAPDAVEEIREFNSVGPRTVFDRIKMMIGIDITS